MSPSFGSVLYGTLVEKGPGFAERLRRELGYQRIPVEVRNLRGELIFSNSAAQSNRHAVVPVLSGSKWILTPALLRLVDQEVLSLDDRLDRYINFGLPTIFRESLGAVTLRQLLSFSSGLSTQAASYLRTELTHDASVRQLLENSVQSPGARETFEYHDPVM